MNFALIYLLEEFEQKINMEITDKNKTYLPRFLELQEYQHAYIDEQNYIAYADDSLFVINLTKKPSYLKKYLQHFFQTLVEISEKWGFYLNSKKKVN